MSAGRSMAKGYAIIEGIMDAQALIPRDDRNAGIWRGRDDRHHVWLEFADERSAAVVTVP
jgi:hypothetical protein